MAALGAAIGLSALTTAGSTFAQIEAEKARREFERGQFESNRRLLEFQKEDVFKRGKRRAQKVREQGRRLIGSQRAALAASGIVVDTGTALDIQEETAAMAAVDAQTVENNAAREAFGLQSQLLSLEGQDARAGMASRFRRFSTIATAGAQFTRDVISFSAPRLSGSRAPRSK